MNYDQFEKWLNQLNEADLKYLEKQPGWKAAHQKAKQSRQLPKDFVEKTMGFLEGGSESET
jgi:hypothetical protein